MYVSLQTKDDFSLVANNGYKTLFSQLVPPFQLSWTSFQNWCCSFYKGLSICDNLMRSTLNVFFHPILKTGSSSFQVVNVETLKL